MRAALIAVVIALLGAACGSPSESSGPPPSGSYDGAWVLVDGRGQDGPLKLVPRYDVTLTLARHSLQGRAGCNHYGGDVRIEGASFRSTAFQMTEMACDEPAMELEADFIAALAEVTTISRSGNALVLEGPKIELRFELVPPPPTAKLTDTPWELQSLVAGSADTGVASSATDASLELFGDGRMEGSTGCRTFTGRWQQSGGEIAVTDFHVEGECPARDRSQDDHVVGVLGDGFTVKIEGRSLEIYGLRGALGLHYDAGS